MDTPPQKFRILVTSAGTSTAFGLIKSISNCQEFEIHTTDINPLHLLPVEAAGIRSHSVVPLAGDKSAYLAAISSLILEKGIDFVYPIHDEEIRVVVEAKHAGLDVQVPSFDSAMVSACTDKLVFGEICRENGVASPATLDAAAFTGRPFFPVFAKPRRGVGSRGARIIGSLEAFAAADDKDHLVFQDLCEAPEVTVDVLSTRCGTIAVARERVEVKAGVSTKCKVWYSSDLAMIAEQLASAFRMDGLFCFQVMRSAGQWAVTDVNPRSGGATAMTVAAGINLYEEYFLRVAGNDDPERFSALKRRAEALRPTLVSRYYQEHAAVLPQ